MFDIGLQELILIFVVALLVFGPKNLPQLGRSLGRAMREFKRASDEFRSTIETNLEINEPDPPRQSHEPAPVETSTASTVAALPDSALTPLGPDQPAAEPAVDEGEPYLAQRGAKLRVGAQDRRARAGLLQARGGGQRGRVLHLSRLRALGAQLGERPGSRRRRFFLAG